MPDEPRRRRAEGRRRRGRGRDRERLRPAVGQGGRPAQDDGGAVHRGLVGQGGRALPGEARRRTQAGWSQRGRHRPCLGAGRRLLGRCSHEGAAARRHPARRHDRRDLHLRRGEQPARCPPHRVRYGNSPGGVRRPGSVRHDRREGRARSRSYGARGTDRVGAAARHRGSDVDDGAGRRHGHGRRLPRRVPEHPARLRRDRDLRRRVLHQQHLLDRAPRATVS